jgi:undecaprenyl-diphosphatase
MAAFVLGYGRSWRWQAPLFLFALLVAWSRIYVGAHYPLDVAGGAVVGIACGWLGWKCYGLVERVVRARRSGS